MKCDWSVCALPEMGRDFQIPNEDLEKAVAEGADEEGHQR